MFDDEFEDQIITEDTSDQQFQTNDHFSFSSDLGSYPENFSQEAMSCIVNLAT
ncbi:hypothetical protein [Marinomonas arenicola]|uniref:Uncharacterized protein n=1 Tax=Marinomonas arenicola TaxID=569601 RepID=A0ABU9G576_9GAMM